MDNWSDQKWLNYALSKMHTGCWYHFKKDLQVVIDNLMKILL